MDPKNPSFVEKHIEKLVLAVAALIVLVVLLYFLILSPFAVEVDRQMVGPDEAVQTVERKVREVERKYENTTIDAEDVPAWSRFFTERYEQPAFKQLTFSTIMGGEFPNRTILGLGDTELAERGTYMLPGAPLVTNLQVRAQHAVFGDTGDDRINQQIIEIIGDETPRDFRYVSVSGILDLNQWAQRLTDVPEQRQIPSRLWRQTFGLAGVYLQRQTYDPATDSWGETTIVQPLPDQLAFGQPGASQTQYNDELAIEHLQLILANQERIARTPFVDTVGGLPWIEPGAEGFRLNEEEQARFTQLQQEIDKLNRRISRQRRTLGLDDNSSDDRQPRQGDGQRQQSEQEKQRREAQRQQLEELVMRRDDLMREKNQLLGIDTATGVDERAEGSFQLDWAGEGQGQYQDRFERNATRNTRNQPQGYPAESDEGDQPQGDPLVMKVWGHDLTIQPGKTYRYRIVATVVNPLFRHRNLTPQQMERNLNRIAVGPAEDELAASSWSQPVSVDPAYYAFFLGATGDLTQGEFEVWTIYDGRWRFASFREHPGDPVGGEQTFQVREYEVLVDLQLSSYLVDLISDGREASGALVADAETGKLNTLPRKSEQSTELQRLRAQAQIEAGFAP